MPLARLHIYLFGPSSYKFKLLRWYMVTGLFIKFVGLMRDKSVRKSKATLPTSPSVAFGNSKSDIGHNTLVLSLN